MFFFLSKVLHFLLLPFSWAIILLVLSFVWKRYATSLRWATLIVLFLFGNSFLLHEVSLLWEVPVTKDEAVNHHQVAVVLGGYSYYSPENDRVTFDRSSDRFLQGLRLLENGTVDKLLLSGGSGFISMPEMKESKYASAFLEEIGIPGSKLLVESTSRNTYENARNTAALLQNKGLDKQRIVLITSGYHMRRAIACFEAQGIAVDPFVADPKVGERMYNLDHLFLPNAEALSHWGTLIHEWTGYAVYWVMGYL